MSSKSKAQTINDRTHRIAKQQPTAKRTGAARISLKASR